MDARVEGHVGALERVERQRADHVGALHQAAGVREREPAHGGDELGAVDERQALLGLEDERRESGGPQRLGRGHKAPLDEALALADEHERQVRERGEVAARAHRALRGDDRVHAPVEHRDQSLERLEANSRETFREDVRAQQHERPGVAGLERRPDARRVRAHEIDLQLEQLRGRNVDVGEVAEAGGDAVDDVAALDGRVHHSARGPHGVARRFCESHFAAVARHGLEPGEIERRAVDHERRGLRERAHRTPGHANTRVHLVGRPKRG